MIVLIAGTTHTGKTALAHKLMKKYNIPYYSIDHLKMGLIRSGQTALTPNDDAALTPQLWSIVKEIVKTAIENKQSLIVEGCYIPFDWQKDFEGEYLRDIKYYCLVMTEDYIENHFSEIVKYENVVERRLLGSVSKSELIADNKRNLQMCKAYHLPYVLIDTVYEIDIEL